MSEAGASPAGGQSLFVGLFPAPPVAAELALRAAVIVDELGLRATRQIRPERLHMTLHFLGRFPEPPREVVDPAVRAVAAVGLEPLAVRFDAVHGFGGGTALGLCAGPGDNAPVRVLRQRLREAFEAAGVTSDPRFDPHMTLAYLARRFARGPVAPVHWAADEIRLAFAVPGQRAYDTLARWPLPRPA